MGVEFRSPGGGTGGVEYLKDLLDTSIGVPVNGSFLKYDSGIGKWISGGVSLALNDLTDVQVPSPVLNSILRYNGVNWIQTTTVKTNGNDIYTRGLSMLPVSSDPMSGSSSNIWVKSTDGKLYYEDKPVQTERFKLTYTPALNQTTYVITSVPVDLSKVEVFINGVRILNGVDFNVSGMIVTLDFNQIGYKVDSNDTVVIYWY